ncbi:MAG TPA: hypothetical protein VMR75_03885 [Candidatus Saccharimonadales bacterium]|nr:hypothetical protein [Candidatus Saccharimonadales bacterium]
MSNKHLRMKGGSSSAVYGLGFIGALVYYIQHAATFGMGVLGFLKALVWPALLIYKLLAFLKM